MKAGEDEKENPSDDFAALREREQKRVQDSIRSLIESIRIIQGDTADRRLHRVAAQLKSLAERFDLLIEIIGQGFTAVANQGVEDVSFNSFDRASVEAMMAMAVNRTSSLNLICEDLLDRLIEATGAERGFILFYLPESTEADVVAARSFQTRNLSLEEYRFSRTLLGEVLKSGVSIILGDASEDRIFSQEASVINLKLKSVLAVPLKQASRTIGVLYLENNSRACAFVEPHLQFAESLSLFTTAYLDSLRLLPVTFERDGNLFLDESKASKEIIGCDAKIIALLDVVERLSDSPATVLIEGESGTGKELVARALHHQGSRRDFPFVAINCAAIPDNLLESELFGHEKGAFTGATQAYMGRIEQGEGGTIFLDEISELAYSLQAKLLRFLQSNEFDRLGGKRPVRVNVRVVAATSKDLKSLVEAGKFQEALYYRLNVIPISVPPLRERRGDIALLTDHFLNKYSGVYGKRATADAEVYGLLREYSFPGNVRELENMIHRMVALAAGDEIRAIDLPMEVLRLRAERISLQKGPLYRLLETPPADYAELQRRKSEIRRVMAEQERQLIERVIDESGGNLTEAAVRLGLHRITLHRILKRSAKRAEDDDE